MVKGRCHPTQNFQNTWKTTECYFMSLMQFESVFLNTHRDTHTHTHTHTKCDWIISTLFLSLSYPTSISSRTLLLIKSSTLQILLVFNFYLCFTNSKYLNLLKGGKNHKHIPTQSLCQNRAVIQASSMTSSIHLCLIRRNTFSFESTVWNFQRRFAYLTLFFCFWVTFVLLCTKVLWGRREKHIFFSELLYFVS